MFFLSVGYTILTLLSKNIWLLSKSLNLIGYQGDKRVNFRKRLKNLLLWLYLANIQKSVYRTIGPLVFMLLRTRFHDF